MVGFFYFLSSSLALTLYCYFFICKVFHVIFQFLTNVLFNHLFQDRCKSFSLKVLLSLALLRSEDYNSEYATTGFAIVYVILRWSESW